MRFGIRRAGGRAAVVVATCGLVSGVLAAPAMAETSYQIVGIGAFTDGRNFGYGYGEPPGTTADQSYRRVAPGQYSDYVVTWNSYYVPTDPPTEVSVSVSGPCGTIFQGTGGAFLFTNGWPEYGVVFRTTMPLSACLGIYRINATLKNLNDGQTETGWSEFTVQYPPPPPVPDEQTRGCGNDLGTTDTTVTRGDPVNTATGAACETFTDVALPAPGIPFAFARTYNSNDSYDGPLGRGWSHPYDMRLAVDGSFVVLRAPDGQQVRYTRQWDDTFTAPPGARSTLSLSGSGYALKTPARDMYTFDGTGNLLAMVDRAGKGVTLTYSGTTLASVTDAAGRTATFTHTGGRVTGIALADGRTLGYGYTAGLLTSVTDLRGKVTTYHYDAGSRLDDVVDPRGHHVLRNTYDAATGRVTNQLDARGKQTTFAWDTALTTSTMTDPRGGQWRDVYRNNVLVQKVDPEGNATTLTYDENLRLVEVADGNGAKTRMTYDARGNLLSRMLAALGYEETWTYNTSNDVLTHKDARGGTTSFGYTASGQVASITDPASGVTAFTFDPSGRVATVKDARLKTTTFGYDAAGNRTSVTTPLGLRTTWTYDGSGRVRTRVSARGNVTGGNPAAYTTTWTYDDGNHVATVKTARGHTTTYSYDDAGNLASSTDPLTRVTTFGYDEANHPTTVTDPRLKTTTTRYDDAGNVAATVDALGNTTTYGYDLAGRRTSMVTPRGTVLGADPLAYTWRYTYDGAGNLKTVVDPRGKTTTFGYDAANRRTSVTDPLGHVSRTGYDANGNVTSVGNALQQATTYTYDALDRPVTETDPRGKATTYTYDAVGNRLSRTAPRGGKTTWTYDDDNRALTMVDPRGNVVRGTPATYTWTYGYDADGHRTTVKDPLALTTTTAYDATGNVASVTDPKSRAVSYGYDELDRLASVSAPLNGSTTYGYDEAGRLRTRTDAKNHTTTYGYDDAGRVTSVTTPLGKVTTFGYDADGNATTKVSPREALGAPGSGTTTTEYDAFGRPTRVAYGGAAAVGRAYDDAGRLTSMTDAGGAETYAYDDADRLTGVTRGGTTFGYAYNASGQVSARTYPDGTGVALTYDDDGGLATVVSGGLTTSYAYDVMGNLTTTTLPSGNGHVETRTWDAAARLTQLKNAKGSTTVSQFALTFDAAGNPTRVATTRGKTVVNDTYAYDAAHRLTQVCYGTTSCTGATATVSYGYDAVGNRASETRLGVTSPGTTTSQYDADDRLTSSTTSGVTTAYGYDEDGNQTVAGARTSTYDLANRVTSTTAAGVTTTYAYDGNGRRAAATTGANTIAYTWDVNAPLAQLVAERTGTGTLIRRYVNGRDGAISMTSGTAGAFYVHRDAFGSVSDVTSATGIAQHRYAYEPFGRARDATKLVTTAPENRLQFHGQYLDSDVGQYHLRARQYDPTTGRFTAVDPITPALTDPYVASYVFAGNRPTVFGDPSGLSFCLLGKYADGSCKLGDVHKDLLDAGKGVVDGTIGFVGDTADAVLHPVETWKGMRDACQAGYDQWGNDSLGGLAQCIDNVNPFAGIRRNYQSGIELARQGCVEAAAEQLARGIWGTATTLYGLKGTRGSGAAAEGAPVRSRGRSVGAAAAEELPNLGDLKRMSPGQLKRYGIDPHQLKNEMLGGEISKFDIYRLGNELYFVEKSTGLVVPAYTTLSGE